MFTAVYGATPWQMPPEAALGLMQNIELANAWKSLQVIQGVSVVMNGEKSKPSFEAALRGKPMIVRDQIRSAFFEMGNK